MDRALLTGIIRDGVSSERPYGELLKNYSLWCDTAGREGALTLFDEADLRSVVSLRGMLLSALSAKNAILFGLDLEGVGLQGAHLEGADLRGCNLRSADLRGTRLAGANLSFANLEKAQLGPLRISDGRAIKTDLTGASLRGLNGSEADFHEALLTGTDLTGADFTTANIRGIEFEGAILDRIKGWN